MNALYRKFSSSFLKSKIYEKLENFLIEIKYPIFEGMIITPILNEISSQKNESTSENFKLLAEYIEILIRFEVGSDEVDQSMSNEIFSILYRKRIFNNFFSKLKENRFQEITIIEFFETIVKYTQKTIDNSNEFFKFIVSRETSNEIFSKENVEKFFNFFISNLISILGKLEVSHFDLLKEEIIENDMIFNQTFRLLNNLNKQAKIYFFDVHTNKNFTDVFFDCFEEKLLKEIILNQKLFTTKFIKENLSEKLPTAESKHFDQDEVLDMIFLILKDNYKFSVLCKNKVISNFSYENNAVHCLKELLSIFRDVYNKEIDIFNSKTNVIERKVIFFFIEIIFKFLTYFDKFQKKLSVNSNITVNKAAEIVSEIQKLLENYLKLLIKDLKSHGYDKLINLFNFTSLNKLTEENIEEIYNLIKQQNRNILEDINRVQLSVESEEFIINRIVLHLNEKIIEQLEVSLKQQPKNKYFDTLIEKTNKIFDEIILKCSISHNSKKNLNQILSNLHNLFRILYLNKL